MDRTVNYPQGAGRGLREVLGSMRHIDREVLRQAVNRTPEFMDPNVIMRRYHPLPGDYEGIDEEITHTYGGGTATHHLQAPHGGRMPGDTGARFVQYPQERHIKESADELWDRKLDEAISHGTYDRIASVGRVLNPVQLSTRRVDPGHESESAGKRIVLGGHHRIAVAADLGIRVPVLHYHGRAPHFYDPEFTYQGSDIETPEEIRHAVRRHDMWMAASDARAEARRIQRETRRRG